MNIQCTCGGSLGSWACRPTDEKVYENLLQCIDCGKDYILKDGEFKHISKAEFRRIVKSRKNYMADILNKYGRNNGND